MVAKATVIAQKAHAPTGIGSRTRPRMVEAKIASKLHACVSNNEFIDEVILASPWPASQHLKPACRCRLPISFRRVKVHGVQAGSECPCLCRDMQNIDIGTKMKPTTAGNTTAHSLGYVGGHIGTWALHATLTCAVTPSGIGARNLIARPMPIAIRAGCHFTPCTHVNRRDKPMKQPLGTGTNRKGF